MAVTFTSGTSGKISTDGTTCVQSVRNWSIEPTAIVATGVASNSGGMEFGVPGPTDFKGKFDFYGYEPPVIPGTSYTFYGHSGDDEFTGGIIIESLTVNCDIAAGGLLSGTVNFASRGAAAASSDLSTNHTASTYNAALTSLTNSSVPDMYSGGNGFVDWAPINTTLGSYAAIPGATGWSLTINRPAHSFVVANAGTMPVTKRIAGPFRGCTASVNFLQGSFQTFDVNATRLLPGTTGALRLYATASLYYQLSYAIVNGLPITNDIEGGAPVGETVNFNYTGHTVINGTNTRGTLVTPGSVAIFS